MIHLFLMIKFYNPSSIKDSRVYSILDQLYKLEIELANAKTYFKENDIALLNLKRKKNS